VIVHPALHDGIDLDGSELGAARLLDAGEHLIDAAETARSCARTPGVQAVQTHGDALQARRLELARVASEQHPAGVSANVLAPDGGQVPTTSGRFAHHQRVLLARYASELKAAGLKRVTVSLDSLDAGVFARMSGGFGGVDEVLAGIEQARRAELTPSRSMPSCSAG